MGTKGNVNRVLDDHLWDDAGREWTCTRTDWANRDLVGELIRQAPRVALHGFGRPFVWLDGETARTLWARVETKHFELPGAYGAEPDGDGLTYAAHVWSSGADRLLGLESFC